MTDSDARIGAGVVWIAVGLAAIYIAIHLPMLSRSLIEWGRLVSALFGQ
jgi:hypothetical protein